MLEWTILQEQNEKREYNLYKQKVVKEAIKSGEYCCIKYSPNLKRSKNDPQYHKFSILSNNLPRKCEKGSKTCLKKKRVLLFTMVLY